MSPSLPTHLLLLYATLLSVPSPRRFDDTLLLRKRNVTGSESPHSRVPSSLIGSTLSPPVV